MSDDLTPEQKADILLRARINAEAPRYQPTPMEALALKRYRQQERERKAREAAEQAQMVFKTNDGGLVRTDFSSAGEASDDAGYTEASTSSWEAWVRAEIASAIENERAVNTEAVGTFIVEHVASAVRKVMERARKAARVDAEDAIKALRTEVLQLETQVVLLRQTIAGERARAQEAPSSDATAARRVN